jgi:hypothetical protein
VCKILSPTHCLTVPSAKNAKDGSGYRGKNRCF